ncbi:MAG: hypothetical protein ACXWQO_11980 [Bdellovibrionota bacterium]
MKAIIVLTMGILLASGSAYANHLPKVCAKELKKAGCTAKTDAEAHECLEKAETHDKKNDGFSAKCYKAHEAFEKKTGTEEHEEEHK